MNSKSIVFVSLLGLQALALLSSCSTPQYRGPASVEGTSEDTELDFKKVLQVETDPNASVDSIQSELKSFASNPEQVSSSAFAAGLRITLTDTQNQPVSVLEIATTLIKSQSYLKSLNKERIHLTRYTRRIDSTIYANSVFASSIGFVAAKIADLQSAQSQGIAELISDGARIALGEIFGVQANAAMIRMKNIVDLLKSQDALTAEEAFDETAGINDIVDVDRDEIGFWQKAEEEFDVLKKSNQSPEGRIAFDQFVNLQNIYFEVPVEKDGSIQVNSLIKVMGTTKKFSSYGHGKKGKIFLNYIDASMNGSIQSVQYESPIYRFREIGLSPNYRHFTVDATVEQSLVDGTWQTTGAHFSITWLMDELQKRQPVERKQKSKTAYPPKKKKSSNPEN